VKDLNREVFAFLTQDLTRLLLHDRACAVMWIDDLISDLVQASDLPVFGLSSPIRRRVTTPPA
jgi:hypothetical protein